MPDFVQPILEKTLHDIYSPYILKNADVRLDNAFVLSLRKSLGEPQRCEH